MCKSRTSNCLPYKLALKSKKCTSNCCLTPLTVGRCPILATPPTGTPSISNASTTYTVGSTVTLGSTAGGSSDGEVTIVSIDGADTMVVSAIGTDATGDEITIVGNNFTLVASDLGLSRLSHIEVMAQENNLVQLNTKLLTTGALQNSTSSATIGEYLLLEPSTLSTGAVVAGDIGTFRVRAYGLL